ncbi:7431_t:CDS:2 [Entrophospora sp. SA101]|nr:7431_t:CDS:2 [Entrophospora sp. SA101]CAJ0851258.1 16722_t:CDS:2 [Entrophospora sp. SA101]
MQFFKLNDSTSIDDDLLSNVKLDSDVEANGVDEGDINDNNDSADPEASQKTMSHMYAGHRFYHACYPDRLVTVMS